MSEADAGDGSDLVTLEVTLNHVNAQALCVNEHWLTNDETSIPNINNFFLAACFCRDRANGGVPIYLRQDVEFLEIDLKRFCTEQHCEIVAVK